MKLLLRHNQKSGAREKVTFTLDVHVALKRRAKCNPLRAEDAYAKFVLGGTSETNDPRRICTDACRIRSRGSRAAAGGAHSADAWARRQVTSQRIA